MPAPVEPDLSGIIKWCAREEWRPHVDAVMAEHFEPAMEVFQMSFEAIDDALGGGWDMTLWGCAFEDFLTRRFGPSNENPVDAYLRRRGWKERVTTRAYMTALQTSVMSLYEVSDIVPGQSLRARDLLRGGEAVLVSERTATRTLQTWDRIAARIVGQNGKSAFAGGLLAFTASASEELFARLRDQGADTATKRRTGLRRTGGLKGWHGSEEDLRRAAPLFTVAWLFDVLPSALHTDPPKLFNRDGDDIVFHTVTFPLAASASADAIAARLNQLTDLQQASSTLWNWLGSPPGSDGMAKTPKGMMLTSTMDDGRSVLGTVELNERFVLLETNSRARADRGTMMVATALAGLVAPPLTEIQTVDQMKAAPRAKQDASATAIPPEVQEQLVHEVLDRHYRALLDNPVPMLGNVTPRRAARTARGREKLVAWLKQLENGSRRAKEPDDPMATYDFAWLWRELKVAHLRL